MPCAGNAWCPIADFLRHKDQRRLKLLDVACGTGRFLRFVKQAFPRLAVTGSDLSEAYLDEARDHLQALQGCAFKPGRGRSLPFADATFDIVTSIYLFHEVPPAIRRDIAREFARVLKPGGLLVFMDSLQPGDMPQVDAMLEAFPANFHEPYYASYLREDLESHLHRSGARGHRNGTRLPVKARDCAKAGCQSRHCDSLKPSDRRRPAPTVFAAEASSKEQGAGNSRALRQTQ